MPTEQGLSAARVPRFVGGGRIEFVHQAVPEPGPGQLLVEVRANALCGTDRAQYGEGSAVTPGHEAAGVVAATGPGTHTRVGTPGVVYLMDFCGTCRSCSLGITNQCLAKRADMGFDRDGGYGAYELVSESIFFPVDADLPLTEATLLLDLMGTSRHALDRASRVRGEDDIENVLVMGAGPVGLGVVAMAHLTLPGVPILVTDLIPYRLELAGRVGGTPVSAAGSDLADLVAERAPMGVDVAVDTTGKRLAREAALGLLAKRGVLVCVGHGEDLRIRVSADLIATERAILGSEYFPYHDLFANLELMRSNRGFLAQVITHRFPVDRIAEAFELFWSGETGKVVVER